jgi:ABC-type Mn2+/Zn2+ transport system ATPase subunit
MSLLTGPNMAGKSTILRSVCAVALLGACGLYAPAAAATLPYFGEAPRAACGLHPQREEASCCLFQCLGAGRSSLA